MTKLPNLKPGDMVNKETAAELVISIKTVEKHRQNLTTKLNIHEIPRLTRYAIEAGIIESSVHSTICKLLNQPQEPPISAPPQPMIPHS